MEDGVALTIPTLQMLLRYLYAVFSQNGQITQLFCQLHCLYPVCVDLVFINQRTPIGILRAHTIPH